MTEKNNNNNSSDEALPMPLFINGRYHPPWPEKSGDKGLKDILRMLMSTKNNSGIPSDPKILDRELPVHAITAKEIENFCNEDTSNKTNVIWIGHASCLVNFQNTIILMDPIFSDRCSPSQSLGPKRYRPVPIKIEDLPRVDAVVISHNHYDHLDYQSVIDLNRKFAHTGLNWFVGLGTAEWFSSSCGITQNVHELNWWESKKYRDIEFYFTPSQHWCARSMFDRNKALWGSWTVVGKNRRFFFAGDTGYSKVFKDIGRKFGPFEYSFIPIGAYYPRWFMSDMHVEPDEAVQIHMDVKSKKSFAIHWGTFVMTYEPYMEPKQKLAEALAKFALDKNNFITLKHGEINQFD